MRSDMWYWASLLAVVVLACSCASTRHTKPTAATLTLTVPQTLGAVFLRPTDVEPNLASALTSIALASNPAAKPQLYKMLLDPHLAKYHPGILSILGIIGEPDDAKKLSDYLMNLPEELAPSQTSAVTAVINSIAYMSHRGVAGAADILNHMCTIGYWRRAHFLWPIGRWRNAPEELVVRSIEAFTQFNEGWRPKVADFYRDAPNPAIVETLQWRLASKRLAALHASAQSVESRPAAPIPAELRSRLASLFNGDLEHPGPAE